MCTASRKSSSDEQGQAVVLLALALVGLLGFAALAIDGGNIYSEQRRAQAAADNAALSAAFAYSQQTTPPDSAAAGSAAANGYTQGAGGSVVAYNSPPTSGAYAGNSSYFQISITQTVPTVLAHLVYHGPWAVSVSAVAYGARALPMMSGFAIAALSPDPACGGNDFSGRGGGANGGTTLHNGGAFVNSPCADAMNMTGGNTVATDGGAFSLVTAGGTAGTNCVSGPPAAYAPSGCNYWPPVQTNRPAVVQDPLGGNPSFIPPSCSSAGTITGTTATPGSYTDIVGTVNLAPGIYCISGQLGDSNSVIRGTNVLIYMTQASSSIQFVGGSASVYLTAPVTGPYTGIVIYKPLGLDNCSNSGIEIDFSGGADMTVVGLIYAPHSMARYGGNGTLMLSGQSLIGCVKFNGNGNLDITYNPTNTYVPPPTVNLAQ